MEKGNYSLEFRERFIIAMQFCKAFGIAFAAVFCMVEVVWMWVY